MPGDQIIREGEKGNEMYFIIEGKVQVLVNKRRQGKGVRDGPIKPIILKEGAFFGEVNCYFFIMIC